MLVLFILDVKNNKTKTKWVRRETQVSTVISQHKFECYGDLLYRIEEKQKHFKD